MLEHKFDVVVIGTGPGGEGAAMQASSGPGTAACTHLHHLAHQVRQSVLVPLVHLARRHHDDVHAAGTPQEDLCGQLRLRRLDEDPIGIRGCLLREMLPNFKRNPFIPQRKVAYHVFEDVEEDATNQFHW